VEAGKVCWEPALTWQENVNVIFKNGVQKWDIFNGLNAIVQNGWLQPSAAV
jgi:hypothetical protein